MARGIIYETKNEFKTDYVPGITIFTTSQTLESLFSDF